MDALERSGQDSNSYKETEKFDVQDMDGAQRLYETKTEHNNMSFKEKLFTDPVYRRKFSYSMFMAASFVALGMCSGQHGPTFLDIQIITDTNLETASAFFTASKAGYLTGSIASGLIYNKISTPLLLFVLTLFHGISNISLPYCTSVIAMAAIRFVSSAFAGGINTGLNSEHMTLWGSNGSGLLQFLHFSFSLGGLLSPLIAEPFLAEKVNLENLNNAALNDSISSNSSEIQSQPETRVEYVFLITGTFATLTAFPFLLMHFRYGEKSKVNAAKRKFTQRNVPFPTMIVMLSGLLLFYFTYCCVEDAFFSFLMTFLVEEFDSVSKSKGAFVTAIAWASFAAARFLMIFVTKLFTTVQILLILTTAMAISFSSFTVLAHFGVISAMIVVAAIASSAFSGVFPSGLSWAEKEMFPVTGIVSSCVFVSGSLGSMVNPLILGNLMESYSNMWFCYILLIQVSVMYFTLIILLTFSRYYVDNKFGSLDLYRTQDRDVPNGIECDSQHKGEGEAQNKLN